MKVRSMNYEKFNINFFCPFGTDWFCRHRCMLFGQIKKASLLFFVSGLDKSCERKKTPLNFMVVT